MTQRAMPPPPPQRGGRNGGFIAGFAPDIILPISLPPLRKVSYSLVTPAAGDYAAGDVLSNSVSTGPALPIPLVGIAAQAGAAVTIYKAFLTCTNNSLLARIRAHIFDVVPDSTEVEMRDNVAFTVTNAAGLAKYKGYFDIPALAARSAGTVAQANQLREEFLCDPRSQDLYMLLTLLDAEANEAVGQIFNLDLYVG